MGDFRKIKGVVRYSGGRQVTIMMLDYNDPIKTLKVITGDDGFGLATSIISHAEIIKDPSEFDPCGYLEEIQWWQSGFDMDVECNAKDTKITEKKFNDTPGRFEWYEGY